MIEIAIVAFTTVFAAVGPVEVALLLPAITPKATPAARGRAALKGTAVATAILLVVAAFRNTALAVMGISLPSLQIAGGILLLILAIDMVFARHSGFTATTVDESNEAAAKAGTEEQRKVDMEVAAKAAGMPAGRRTTKVPALVTEPTL